MKKILLLVGVMFIVACSDSGGGSTTANPNISTNGTCTFDVKSFTNGDTASASKTYWTCSSDHSFSFSVYNDGTGESSDLGVFAWKSVGCGEIDGDSTHGSFHAYDFFTQPTKISFKEDINGQTIAATCNLQQKS